MTARLALLWVSSDVYTSENAEVPKNAFSLFLFDLI